MFYISAGQGGEPANLVGVVLRPKLETDTALVNLNLENDDHRYVLACAFPKRNSHR